MTVTLEQFADEVGVATPPADSQKARQWLMWADDALLQIRVRLGDVAALDQDVVDYVVRKAVAEKAKRPDGATERTTSVDDASVTRRYEKSSGQVTILPEWWAMLSPAASSGRAFVIDTAPKPSAPTYGDRPDLWMQWASPLTSPWDELPEGARDL